jgi:hypothetical protein
MGTIVTEKPDSRSIKAGPKGASAVYKYDIKGAMGTAQAFSSLLRAAPQSVIVHGYTCADAEYTCDPVHTPDHYNTSLYRATVSYKSAESANNQEEGPQEPTDDTQVTFDIASTEDVVLYSPNQLSYDKNGKTKKKFTAINKHHANLPPEGYNINTPVGAITAKTVLNGKLVDVDWFRDRLDQVWTLNSASWNNFPKKSVMLTGISAQDRTDNNWDITYSFEYRPTRAGATFDTGTPGESITVPSSGGWQILWLEYSKTVVSDDDDETEDEVSREVKRVHISDIYTTSDFDSLGMVGI